MWALSPIQKLYRTEKACQGKPPDDVYRLRQAESKPLMEAFARWLSKTDVLPKGYPGKAIGYCQKQWPKLMRYLEDGRPGIDNNRASRAIKPFVIGRRNWLFANTEAGAHASALLYSLVESARINGLNQYDYLHALLTALKFPDAEIARDALLPGKSPCLKPRSLSLCGSNDAYATVAKKDNPTYMPLMAAEGGSGRPGRN